MHASIFQVWGLFFVWIDKNALYTDYFDKKTREKIHHSQKMGVKMNSLMPKKSEILQRFEIDKKKSFFSIKEMALIRIRDKG